jgi:uncharacterized protein YbjT (DUF2867 family)
MIVVTAPTGRIGSRLLPLLLNRDEPLRIIARDPARLPAEARERAEVVVGSHRDPLVVDRALDGADALFWLMPGDRAAAGPYEAYVAASIPAADAVVRHGVERVVTISALGRGTGLYAGHVSASWAMDDLFRSTGAHLRALTNPSFMDNLLWQAPAIATGVVRGTLPPDLAMPWVATADIADAAARLLGDREWTGQDEVALLGPEDLSLNDIAGVLGEALGTPVRYERGDRAALKRSLVDLGYSEPMAQGMIDMDLAGERGINNALARTAGNTTPTTFRAFVEEILVPAIPAPRAATS